MDNTYYITGNKVGTRVSININGKFHSKECGTNDNAKDFFELVLDAKANPTKDKVEQLYGYLNENIRVARKGGFEIDIQTGKAYFAGFNTPVPSDLFETVQEYLDEGYPIQSIINFWTLLMANPDKRVREDLFKFIQTHDFSLTDKGYMLVYKTVDFLHKVDADLASFVSESFLKIKKWKKAPSKHNVYRVGTDTIEMVVVEDEDGYYDLEDYDDYDEYLYEMGYEPEWIDEEEGYEEEQVVTSWEYKLSETEPTNYDHVELLGNLADMQAHLTEIQEENQSTFTDKHTNTMSIRLGVPVKMDRKNCDGDPKNECSYGLHVGATKYVENFRGGGESPVLVCLVNPMHVIAVPEYDNSKMRVCEYFPFAKGTVDKNGKIDIITTAYFESDYVAHEETELQALLKANEDIRPSAINTDDDDRDFNEYKEILKSRVMTISK